MDSKFGRNLKSAADDQKDGFHTRSNGLNIKTLGHTTGQGINGADFACSRRLPN